MKATSFNRRQWPRAEPAGRLGIVLIHLYWRQIRFIRNAEPGGIFADLFTIMALKRTKQHVTTPGELDVLLADRLKQLGCYASFNEYVNSLVLYDCWAEKPHLLTGPVFERRREQLPALVAEVVRDYGKPGKTGSFFEHRLEEVIIERVLQRPPTERKS